LEGGRARRRPNWWVILAVTLALIALLVETSGRGESGRPLQVQSAASARGVVPHDAARPLRSDAAATTSSTTTTSTTTPAAAPPVTTHLPTVDVHTTGTNAALPGSTTSTSRPVPTTTTSAPPAALPADRTQTEGYLDPPLLDSGAFEVDQSGPAEVSVLWSPPVYLTMTVTCPSGSQTVGGTTAMEMSLPDASGCQATVSEPSSESTSLTYTFSIGPAGG
jgi:hypothetical protein